MNTKERAKRIRSGNNALMSAYRVGKALVDISDDDISSLIGVSRSSLWRRKNNPGEFRLQELRTLAEQLHWTAEDWLYIGGYNVKATDQ